ncbi:Golgi CORVET complex core vacuolar protein 8-domain-containing protein [Tirmania nivea]|nr:Golgi CORVET complex core vacuolar protein 8-domain-containing protein [Tirmania nivea]
MSSLPEGSSDIREGGDHGEDGNGVAAEWENVWKGLERTAAVGVVLSNENAHTRASGKVSVGDAETGMDDDIEGSEMDGGLSGSNLEDAEDSGASQKVMEYLHDAREDTEAGSAEAMFRGYQKIHHEGRRAEDMGTSVSSPTLSTSIADDTQSVHDSVASSPGGSAYGSRLSSSFHSPSPSLRPFDRRFQSRLQPQTPSPLPSAFLTTNSRSSSALSQQDQINGSIDANGAPWDVIRWTKLKKITAQVFSEVGRRNFGTPTCISIAATIVIGTSKGIILVFDYVQNLKNIIGPGTKAVECGSITALAVSADHTTIAGGHSQGHIFIWELAKPARPFLSIPPVSSSVLEQRKLDGHIEGVSVLHLGFLGTRHTALVSADGHGMAFSHLATRGFGALVRIVKTARILGRYPPDIPVSGIPRKPSSVLAFAPLPLGNSVQATDSMSLVAILTPYLLVVISTTPVAQTQHKASRPKEVAHDKALSGCVAWFPSVKLKESSVNPDVPPKSSKAKLAYSWSNVLTILELSIAEPEPSEDPNRPPVLHFRAKSRWECDEAIVAVQWISRQILGALTATQRLIILEEPGLHMTETFDLMPKQIIHHRHFRHHLMPLIDTLDKAASFHSAIADAFYNSFKTYKGRIFLLCQYEVSVGVLSNWADRLLAMMEDGDFIGAIRLATAYYVGEVDKITVGLPEEPRLRHPLVREKLLEMMAASLRYAFGRTTSAVRSEILGKDRLQELATVCFVSCLCMGTTDFLYDEVFEYYEGGGFEDVFLETLEPYILEGRITSVPPVIIKALILHFSSLEQESRLEEMICHLDTTTMDIDQVTTLCKHHNLYDALIYVWNCALGDYITPMIDLLSLLKPIVHRQELQNGDSIYGVNALKVFPYLSYTLTGRIYPTGEPLSDAEAIAAKAAVYYFLFLGRTITWPRQGGAPFLTKIDGTPEQSFPYLRLILQFDAPSFLSALNEAFEDPFLNGPADQTTTDMKGEGTEEQMFARSVNRQYIITILQEVMNSKDFPPQDTVYLNMFIARNLPKFQQFILLTGSALNNVLVGLCNYPGVDIADDCQLSVEYLLSVYHPPDEEDMVALFEKAKFYRVLKSIFRAEKQYGKLFLAYLKDEDSPEAVFGCIEECLRPQNQISAKQRDNVRGVIIENARKLIDIDSSMAAMYIDAYAADLHGTLLDAIQDRPQDQFFYLRAILEPPSEKEGTGWTRPEILASTPSLVELYVRLMCKYDARNVHDFVGRLQSGDLRLEEVLPSMEESGVVDATVQLMAREGQIRNAMDRLIGHLHGLEAALLGLLQAHVDSGVENGSINVNDGAEELLASLRKYTQVGIWLCQDHMQSKSWAVGKDKRYTKPDDKDALSQEELLWLDFIDTIVQIAKNCTSRATPSSSSTMADKIEVNGVLVPAASLATTHHTVNTAIFGLRKLVQTAFTALLTSTATPSSSSTTSTGHTIEPCSSSSSTNTSFLRILRAFLSRASLSSPSLSELRSVLAGIFDAYMYENQLLSLANKLLDKDRFQQVDIAVRRRTAGWRPLGQACEACGRRAWGPGAAGGIFAAWEKGKIEKYRREKGERERKLKSGIGAVETQQTWDGGSTGWGAQVGNGKGKEKMRTYAVVAAGTITPTAATTTTAANTTTISTADAVGEGGNPGQEASELMIFTCRHVYHKICLEKLQSNGDSNGRNLLQHVRGGGGVGSAVGGGFRCLACEKPEGL